MILNEKAILNMPEIQKQQRVKISQGKTNTCFFHKQNQRESKAGENMLSRLSHKSG